ncbi:hypothetical protein [Streptomyces sp. GC420]|uniref:hypothetical protein n=1 Tax=Streptomyces sp. GC420 TaxID=2697568 RepID=UPI001414E1B5|nr:hypothetical protein [Streptomyces sp. GC420]NBM16921.1 hypothetical protein [Streptomyces sp. GC420]
MPSRRPRVLYVTDLAYEAKGRRYCDEDIRLSARLREDFAIALCHPAEAVALMDAFDLVMVRNSGPVLGYRAAYDTFRTEAARRGTLVYNPLTGRGDMAGKQYLLDLSAAGFPVVPTVDRPEDLGALPVVDEYVVKPREGADSIGLEFVTRDRLPRLVYEGMLVQPRVDFRYEVSFCFVDHTFQYALRTVAPERRWELEPYEPTAADLEFAQRFIDWNGLDHGIQRVDACRGQDGRLLLVELEDLNPYLSLGVLEPRTQDAFVTALKASLTSYVAAAATA